ncbi:hypothetical protein [Bradyrhizobium sp. CCBAU 51765]|uniref:hypothetical protein n=1 Tax=Bradyrhizobium sp. CCBAU 51765 TaxID=1325102 RepID=UPI0018875F35|nr:hypothetical protein [Bradyrhizobium sp. CCBAU 51765]QOZ09252.1 hypothetical protein XH96_18235 [Bradyrhizobium sp. CCBAU 51765]
MVDRQVTFDNGRKSVTGLETPAEPVAPYGQRDDWPSALSIAASFIQNADHPMLILWGSDRTEFYNKEIARIAGPIVHVNHPKTPKGVLSQDDSGVFAKHIEDVLADGGDL